MTALPFADDRPYDLSSGFEHAIASAVRSAFHSATGVADAELLGAVERSELVGHLESLRSVLYDLLARVEPA